MSVERCYWDADCFLGWLQGEADKVDACRGVLEEASRGRLLIVTSALTIAEVLTVRGRERIGAAKRDRVTAFFRHEYITVENVTRRIAEAARDVVWNHGIMAKDAVHVATALAAKVPVLHTFDVNLQKRTGLVGSPPLTICRPFVTQGTLDLPPPST